MPNLINPQQIPGGYFYQSDNHIEYQKVNSAIPSPSRTITLVGKDPNKNHTFIKLLDENEETMALLRLVLINICQENYYQIHKIGSIVKLKGYAKYLYSVALECLNYPLLSDSTLTLAGSYDIWQSFIKKGGLIPCKVFVLNIQDEKIDEYNPKKVKHFYWGLDNNFLDALLEFEDNLDYMRINDEISQGLYDFINDNMMKIKDKKDIRLILRKN